MKAAFRFTRREKGREKVIKHRKTLQMILRWGLIAWLAALVFPSFAIDPVTTLECHRRQYSYQVKQADSEGRECWDHINVMSCWGRCDSNEIADWKFPYKKSHHPVCLHSTTQSNTVTLRNCDPNAAPGTDIYTFQEAASCACTFCRSSEASCEGLRYRGARSVPRQGKRANHVTRKESSLHRKSSHAPRIEESDILQGLALIKALETDNNLIPIIREGPTHNDLTREDLAQRADPKFAHRKDLVVFGGQIPFLDTSDRRDYASFMDFPLNKRESAVPFGESSYPLRLGRDPPEILNLDLRDADF